MKPPFTKKIMNIGDTVKIRMGDGSVQLFCISRAGSTSPAFPEKSFYQVELRYLPIYKKGRA